MSGRQGRQESSIDPTHGPQALFAQRLRDLRKACGSPTYRELASWTRKIGTPYSDTTLSSAARGHELPSWDVTSAFVRACLSYAKTSGEQIEADVDTWASRWRNAKAELSSDGPSPSPGEESAERTEPRQECEETGEEPRLPGPGRRRPHPAPGHGHVLAERGRGGPSWGSPWWLLRFSSADPWPRPSPRRQTPPAPARPPHPQHPARPARPHRRPAHQAGFHRPRRRTRTSTATTAARGPGFTMGCRGRRAPPSMRQN